RPTVRIMVTSRVARVRRENGGATGVRVRLGQGWTEIHAREILLCAGAIHSPAILMRSGIGPAAALTALGVPILRNLPAVGQNFMDHPILRATITLRLEHISRNPDQRHTNCCVTS